jgi:hypothetical protein
MNVYSGENFMNLKKTLISVGFSAVLSAVPLIAQADLTPAAAVKDGVEVLVTDSTVISGQKLVLTENVAGAVSAGTIVLALDNNAEFVSATVAGWGTNGGEVTSAVTDGKLILTVASSSAVANTITISAITIDTSKSAVDTDINISKDTTSTATGADFSATKIATVVEPSVTITNVSGTVPSFKPNYSTDILDILIKENAIGAINADGTVTDEITISLQSGWLFDVDSNAGTPTGNLALTEAAETGLNKKTIDVTTASSTAASQITLGSTTNLKVKAPSNATNGDVNATITVQLSNSTSKTETIKIGEVTDPGIKATVVDKTVNAFNSDPTADTTLPEYPLGFLDAELDSIMIVENFGDDLTVGDELILTLPSGVKFSENVTKADDSVTSTISSPNGYDNLTIDVTALAADTQGGILIGSTATGIKVDIDSTATVGDLTATLSGKVNGSDITPLELVLAKIVTGGVSIEANDTIPTHGVGSSAREIGSVTLTEVVAGALKANNNTITFTLPTGTSWAAAPDISGTNGLLFGGADSFTAGDTTVTFPITTASTSSASVITVSGTDVLNIDANFTPGDIKVTVGGTAGASGEVLVATAATGTSVAVGDVPQLTAGGSAQKVATITITESFAGALSTDGKFRLILPANKNFVWAPAVPTITTSIVDGETGVKLADTVDSANSFNDSYTSANSWEFELATSFTSNDTLIIQVPNVASTGPTVVEFAGLKVNVPAGTPDGEINVSLADGNAAGTEGAGVTQGDVLVGIIGEIPAFTVDPLTVKVAVGATVEVTASGGLGTAKIGTAPDTTIATATITDGKVTITGVAEGTTSVIISDGSSTPQTKTVSIEVTPAEVLKVDPATVEVEVGKTVDVTISGGTAPYTAVSSDDATATATLATTKVTITGVKEGTATITVEDSADPKGTVEIAVTVKADTGEPEAKPGTAIDGTATDSKFKGGAKGADGYKEKFSQTEPVDVESEITVDTNDVDKKGWVYVVAQVPSDVATNILGNISIWYKTTLDGNPVWAGWVDFPNLATLKPLEKEAQPLKATITIDILSGFIFENVPGEYNVYIGYKVDEAGNTPEADTTMKFNANNPIKFVIE